MVSVMGKTSRQKSNKETEDLNNATRQLDLTDVYRTLRPAQQNTHPSQVHTEHLQKDHMAGHKTSLRHKKDWGNRKYLLWPQWNETGNLENYKIHKYI